MPKTMTPTADEMLANKAEYEKNQKLKDIIAHPETKIPETVHIVASSENLVVLDGRLGGYLGKCAKCKRSVTQFKKKRDSEDPSDEDFRIALDTGDFETARKFVCSYEEVREMTIREWMVMKGGSAVVSQMGFGDSSPFAHSMLRRQMTTKFDQEWPLHQCG